MSDDNDQPMSGAELIKWREEQERQLIPALPVPPERPPDHIPHELKASP